jgi:hypothetical protein
MVGDDGMTQLLDVAFEFVLFSSLSERQHEQQADKLHMAAVEWAEQHSLGIGGGFRVHAVKGGALSRHQFGLCATSDGQLVSIDQAQSLFAHLQATARQMGSDFVGGYHQFQEAG